MAWRSGSGRAKKRAARTSVWREPEKQTAEFRELRPGVEWQDLIAELSALEGSDTALAKRIGFKDGSRVSEWKRGTERRPSATTCALLAVLYNFNALDVLRIGGHDELADLLAQRLPANWAKRERQRESIALEELRRVKRYLDEAYGRLDSGGDL